MLHHELVAPVEQIGQRFSPGRAVENIGLVDPDPGERAALGPEYRVGGSSLSP
jgi:hypothetical protein